jgi:hypothetical protein
VQRWPLLQPLLQPLRWLHLGLLLLLLLLLVVAASADSVGHPQILHCT